MANASPLQAAADKLVQVFHADASLSSVVREIVRGFCEAHAVPDPWKNRAQVIADELYMNAVKYGSVRQSDLIFLGMRMGDGTLSLSIEDRGTRSHMTPDALRAILAQRQAEQDVTNTEGRGLSLIVKGWSQEIRIEESTLGGIKVTSVIALS